jgi:hypothetical protein
MQVDFGCREVVVTRQASCFGAIVSVSRGSSAGSERRAGFLAAFSFTAMIHTLLNLL